MIDRLKNVPLFQDLQEEDLALLRRESEEVRLAAGEMLFKEGDPGDRTYVIVEGSVEILKEQQRGAQVMLAVRDEGEVLGEIALLLEEPRSASVRARTDLTLIAFSRMQFESLLEASSTALRSVFGVVLERWRNTQSKLRHSERMAQLGTLTAGMMHELNNPASAVTRGTTQLPGMVDEIVHTRDRLLAALGGAPTDDVTELIRTRPPKSARPTGPLDLTDREESLEDWLDARGHAAAFRVASRLAPSGYTVADVDALEARLGEATMPFVDHLAARCEIEALMTDAEGGSRRISSIVETLKSYSFVDQAPVQDIDVAAGVEDTLAVLGNTLAGIEVEVAAEPDLPNITAHAAELNQVWTNLIDNAVDAIEESGRSDGRIVVRVARGDGSVVVEVEDNGVGIADDIADRIFDPFFTTKEPGSGTGLGLDLVSGIVVDKHHGHISAACGEGSTVFRVELPTTRAD